MLTDGGGGRGKLGGMRIEPAGPEDLPQLARIWEAAVRATHRFLAEEDILLLRPLVRDGYLPAARPLAVARGTGGEALGFAGAEGRRLEMLFVDPARHRGGIGTALLRHAVDAWEVERVDVNEQNPQALAFYLRRGFVVASRSERDGLGKPFPLLHLRRG